MELKTEMTMDDIDKACSRTQSTCECPVCHSPLRAITRQDVIKFTCMNLVNCTYTRVDPWYK